jgi:hypothetical protein
LAKGEGSLGGSWLEAPDEKLCGWFVTLGVAPSVQQGALLLSLLLFCEFKNLSAEIHR